MPAAERRPPAPSSRSGRPPPARDAGPRTLDARPLNLRMPGEQRRHPKGVRHGLRRGQTSMTPTAHVMELPGTINRYLDPKHRAAFAEKTGRGDASTHWSTQAQARHDDPDFKPAPRPTSCCARTTRPWAPSAPPTGRRRWTTWLHLAAGASPPPASPTSAWSRRARSSWRSRPPAPTTA
jgi:hypothetical protein